MKKILFKIMIFMLSFAGMFILITGTSTKAATVKLNKTKVTLDLEEKVKLKVKNTTKKVKWSSSDKSIARVSVKGNVYAVSKGECTITAKVGKKTYTCEVTVIDSIGEMLDETLELNDVIIPISSKWELLEEMDVGKDGKAYSTDKNVFKVLSLKVTKMKKTECESINESEENFTTALDVSSRTILNKKFGVTDSVTEVITDENGFIGRSSGASSQDGNNYFTLYMKVTDNELILILIIEPDSPSENLDKIVRRMCMDIKKNTVPTE